MDYPELKENLQNTTSLRLRKVTIPGTQTQFYCDDNSDSLTPFVTKPFRRQVVENLHSLSHTGTNATVKLIAQLYVRPGMKKDCRQWTRTCHPCQQTEFTQHVSSPLGKFKLPRTRLACIHIFLVGPLPVSNEYKYCLVVIDCFNRCPEAIPIKNIIAKTVAKALISGWIARFGCPSEVVTDRGRQFEPELFKALLRMVGFQHKPTTAFHPACNVMIERFYRQLKAVITCHANTNWTGALPLVLALRLP
ncbi:unnamed protein product [Parnassius mnemosyne]|uniref:RNA-directed DNA polymerase n=1 Tax=Parnassius mnemosyne TaxID=213953 RepID=A0AAV1M967_9NEOP